MIKQSAVKMHRPIRLRGSRGLSGRGGEEMRRRDWGVWAACIAGLLVLTACQGMLKPTPETGSALLAAQVREYLRADDQEAERLFEVLSTRSVEELERALDQVSRESYPPRPATGMLPARPLWVGSERLEYGLYVPPAYDPSKAYPLIICLHGAGFDGDSYLDRWRPRLGDDFLLACPTMEWGAWWTAVAEELVLAVIHAVSREYHVDRGRVFLTGMSNGGIGVYLIGLNHADRFAALVPMASALPPALFPLLDNARDIPFYVIHGEADQVMPVRFSREVVAYLERNGLEVIYREHEHVHPVAGGHFFPREELPDLLEWLKTRQRTPMPRELTLVRDRDHIGRGYWLQIDEISPDAASFWASEHDREEGQRLKDGAYARITATVAGNSFRVTTERVLRYSILIDKDLVDLDEPVRVVTNGQVSFSGYLEPDVGGLLREARRRPHSAPVRSVLRISLDS